MIEGRDFVFTGLQPWDMSIGSNARDIALEVSKHNRVLYVNTPLSKSTPLHDHNNADASHRLKVLGRESSPLRKINDNLWILDFPFRVWPVNKLPDGKLFDFFNKKNNNNLFSFIRKTVSELGFSNIIHFNDNDIYRSFYAKEFLEPTLSIYYRRDNLLAIDFWKRHACRLEPMLIAKSDLVVSNSAYLVEGAMKFNERTFDIGQGVDLNAYNAPGYSVPDDIVKIPRPIIGYLGHITSLRLDVQMIYDLALRNPKRSVVLVGSVDEVFRRHSIKNLPNVYFLGPKPQHTVAQYINSFDICINPQALNDLTIGNYPRKIDEYLSLGKPVLATRTDAMLMFEKHVYLCDNIDEYQQSINKIINNDTVAHREARVTFAHTHTWEASVSALYRAIKTTV